MKKITKKKTYSVDHVAVILEDIQSKFYVLDDGQKMLNEKIDRNHEEFVEFREETKNNFNAVANAFTEVNDRIDGLETKVDNMQGDIRDMKVDIKNMQGDIGNMQRDVTEIKHKLSEKVDLKDFQNLEKRFIKLEKLVFAKLA